MQVVPCGVCGRPLKSPKSIEAGVGPVCREVLEEQKAKAELNEND